MSFGEVDATGLGAPDARVQSDPMVISISYPSGSLRKAEYEPDPCERCSPGSETLTPPALTPFSHAALTATIPSAEKLSSPKPGWGSCLPETKKTGLAMAHPIVWSCSKCRRQPSGASIES